MLSDCIPKSRLAKLKNAETIDDLKLCDSFNFEQNEYFFDRDAWFFPSIIQVYRTGKLHLIENVCVLSFKDELDYWAIDESYLKLCCQQKYHLKIGFNLIYTTLYIFNAIF